MICSHFRRCDGPFPKQSDNGDVCGLTAQCIVRCGSRSISYKRFCAVLCHSKQSRIIVKHYVRRGSRNPPMSKAVESEGRKDLTVMVAGKNSSGSPQPWMNPWSASVPLLMPHVASCLPFLHLHVASNHNKGDPVFRLSSLARISPRGSKSTIFTPTPTPPLPCQ